MGDKKYIKETLIFLLLDVEWPRECNTSCPLPIKLNIREKERTVVDVIVGGQRLRSRRRATRKVTRGSSKASSRVASLWQCRSEYPSTVASSTIYCYYYYYYFYYYWLLPPASCLRREQIRLPVGSQQQPLSLPRGRISQASRPLKIQIFTTTTHATSASFIIRFKSIARSLFLSLSLSLSLAFSFFGSRT